MGSQHWETVHQENAPDEVSWYQVRPDTSLDLIRETGVPPSARLIDVGGGISNLVDHLLDEGFQHLTVLDLSRAALDRSRGRLAERASQVEWLVGDAASVLSDRTFDLWHERAVLHFLTDDSDRRRHLDAMAAAVVPGGHAIVAVFAEDGPLTCSTLPVRRYSLPDLQEAMSGAFDLVAHRRELHRTPGGREQSFLYGWFRRR